MTILVLGGTGTVGSQLVQDLAGRGIHVRVLTRTPEKTRSLPAGAEGVRGDLLEPQTVRTVFAGADAVFLLNAVSPTEAHEGLMAVNGARMAGVKRLVYLSVHHVDRAPHLPHFGAKIPVEEAVKTSGIPYTILRPNNFYQNDYWLKDALLQHGVYTQPLGSQGLSRVDVRDISDAAVAALTSDEHGGQTYNLVGPDVLTGASTADAWSRALGRTIAYAGDDLDVWEQQSLQYMPAWLVFDFRLMYAFFQEHGLRATPEDLARQTRLIGHAPRRFEEFAAETARAWTG
jgi:uncharacterized protein YbjT (DUF2867 family)